MKGFNNTFTTFYTEFCMERATLAHSCIDPEPPRVSAKMGVESKLASRKVAPYI